MQLKKREAHGITAADEIRRETGDLVEIPGNHTGIEDHIEWQATGAINVDLVNLIQRNFGVISPPLLGQVDMEGDVDQVRC